MKYGLTSSRLIRGSDSENMGQQFQDFVPDNERLLMSASREAIVSICYLVKLSRWCGALEVESDAFEDTTPIFADTNDPFSIRFKVKPQILLDFENAIPIEQPELWNSLSFTKTLPIGVLVGHICGASAIAG